MYVKKNVANKGGSHDSPLFVFKEHVKMEWTREQRYRRLEDEDSKNILKLEETVNSCPWRQVFHIQPKTGLLNDPNGFSFYNGEYHLFYQWFPLGPVHGLKYWYHTKSKDLVNWENAGVGIAPDHFYESHGVYSGSAIEHEDKLYLMYTGNVRDENWERHPYQCLAIMDKNGVISKLDYPIIADVPSGYTDHFRDPKVWKDGEYFYVVIGAQREDETGCIVLYRSKDLIDWECKGEMNTTLQNFGFMWECPDYIELGEQGLLIFSPQGLDASGDHYHNIYQSGYLIGEKLDLEARTFKHGQFQELDRGFDFYAPQTMEDPDGRRIMVGWMGLPEIAYPTDKNGWAHCLTLPRELLIKNDKLIQRPVKELQALRKQQIEVSDRIENEKKNYQGIAGTTYELICDVKELDADEFGIEFRANGEEKTVFKYDVNQKKIILDRSLSGEPVGESYGTERKCHFNQQNIKLHLFVDTSSVEIFINDGEEVFTSRIFPHANSDEIYFYVKNGTASFTVDKWDI